MIIKNRNQALKLWKQTLLQNIKNKEHDLTMRQMTILLIIYLNPPPHTVTQIAKMMEVTKPVVTRALNSMTNKGLVKRMRDKNDKRNVLIQRTTEGAEYLERFSQNVIEQARIIRDEI